MQVFCKFNINLVIRTTHLKKVPVDSPYILTANPLDQIRHSKRYPAYPYLYITSQEQTVFS